MLKRILIYLPNVDKYHLPRNHCITDEKCDHSLARNSTYQFNEVVTIKARNKS